MISPNVNRILEAAQILNEAERQELHRLLDEDAVARISRETKEPLNQSLRKRGVTRTIPPRPTPEAIARFRAWRPIKMSGGSLSDELVRDRR